jgi:hypothetical protein
MIPEFRDDGYLPEGVHLATEAEVVARFGASSPRRRRLVPRLRRWVDLCRQCRVIRLLIDGSFVTAKVSPDDVDAVVLLSNDFEGLVAQGLETALELEEMLLTRCPAEVFAAEDDCDWNDWVEFFGRTRESDGRRKGLVEVRL